MLTSSFENQPSESLGIAEGDVALFCRVILENVLLVYVEILSAGSKYERGVQ